MPALTNDENGPHAHLKNAIAVMPQYIADSDTTIVVKQQEFTSCGRAYTVRNEDDSVLFVVKGDSASMTQRRRFEDASGQPLFDLRRRVYSKSRHWYLDRPGEDKDSLMTANIRCSLTLGLKLTIKNAGTAESNGPSDVTLDVLEMGCHGVKTVVLAGDDQVATIHRTASDGSPSEKMSERMSLKKRPIWTIRVVQGLDMSLAAAIGVMCAEHYPEYHFTVS